jgi:hypothetical protein
MMDQFDLPCQHAGFEADQLCESNKEREFRDYLFFIVTLATFPSTLATNWRFLWTDTVTPATLYYQKVISTIPVPTPQLPV